MALPLVVALRRLVASAMDPNHRLAQFVLAVPLLPLVATLAASQPCPWVAAALHQT
jgi:hypothetical protein